MIKLTERTKFFVSAGILCAAIAFGFVIDRLDQTRFTVEKLPPGEVNEYAPEPAEAAAEININTATTAELTELEGIGEVIAEDIVRYREENGAFNTVDELLNITGIGEDKLDRIRGDICK